MRYRKCEICNFRSQREDGKKRRFMSRLPRDEVRCKQWVKVIGKEDLAYVPIEKLNQLKFVCGKHFKDKDFKRKKTQLKKTAVPSIGLTAEPLSDDILIEFPLHIFKEQQPPNEEKAGPQIDHCYSRQEHSDHSYSKGSLKENHISESPGFQEDSPSLCINEEPDTTQELKVCRICLAINVKMFHLGEYNLNRMLQNVTGIVARENEGIFLNVCWECSARLSAASAFKNKALQSDAMLQRLLNTNDTIRPSDIQFLKDNHEILKPTLSIQEVFYTADIGETDPNNLNPDMEIIDEDLLNKDTLYIDADTTHDDVVEVTTETYMEINETKPENLKSTLNKKYTKKKKVKIHTNNDNIEEIPDIKNKAIIKSIKMNDDGSITLENTNIRNQDIEDFNDNADQMTTKDDLIADKNDKLFDGKKTNKLKKYKRSTTEEFDLKIIERFKELKCSQVPQLAREFGITVRVIRRILKNAGLKASPMKKLLKKRVTRLTEDTKNIIISMKENGVSVPDIARQLGIGRSTIYFLCHRWYLKNKNNEKQDDIMMEQDENVPLNEYSDQDHTPIELT